MLTESERLGRQPTGCLPLSPIFAGFIFIALSISLYDEMGIIPLICATILTAIAIICETITGKDEE